MLLEKETLTPYCIGFRAATIQTHNSRNNNEVLHCSSGENVAATVQRATSRGTKIRALLESRVTYGSNRGYVDPNHCHAKLVSGT